MLRELHLRSTAALPFGYRTFLKNNPSFQNKCLCILSTNHRKTKLNLIGLKTSCLFHPLLIQKSNQLIFKLLKQHPLCQPLHLPEATMSTNMSTSSPSFVARTCDQQRNCPGAPVRPRAVARTSASNTTILASSARKLFADDMESTCLRERECPGAPVRPAARARLNTETRYTAQRVLEFHTPCTPHHRHRASIQCPGAPARLQRIHRNLQDGVCVELFPADADVKL
jgi:hypothetical protein